MHTRSALSMPGVLHGQGPSWEQAYVSKNMHRPPCRFRMRHDPCHDKQACNGVGSRGCMTLGVVRHVQWPRTLAFHSSSASQLLVPTCPCTCVSVAVSSLGSASQKRVSGHLIVVTTIIADLIIFLVVRHAVLCEEMRMPGLIKCRN